MHSKQIDWFELPREIRSPTGLCDVFASKIGLKINVKKAEVMSFNTKQPPKIQPNGNLMNTNSFTYLGSIVTNDGGAEEDIKARLGL